MAWVEFKIADTSHSKLQQQWRDEGKCWNEIALLMEKRLDDARKDQQYNLGNQSPTKFPKLVRDLMKKTVEKHMGSVPKHDPDNDIYKTRIPGDLPEATDFYEDFDAAYKQLIKENESVREWSETNDVRITMSGHDEQYEMKELEDRNPSQGSPVMKPPEKKKDD
jgi:hypothetical protein